MWKLNNIFFNNQWVKKEITREIGETTLETSENENITYQNLWDAVKAVLRGKFIVVNATERSLMNNQASRKNETGWQFMFQGLRDHAPWMVWPTITSDVPSLFQHLWLQTFSSPHVHILQDVLTWVLSTATPQNELHLLQETRVCLCG